MKICMRQGLECEGKDREFSSLKKQTQNAIEFKQIFMYQKVIKKVVKILARTSKMTLTSCAAATIFASLAFAT